MNICIRLNNKDERWVNQFTKLEEDYPVKLIIKTDEELDLTDIDILVSTKISVEELQTANRLKAFFLTFTGVNRLPLLEMSRKNITVCNSHANADLVALKAFTLSLSMLGKITPLHNALENGLWQDVRSNSSWESIYNKKIGLLGMGEIGQHIIKLLEPFNCQIHSLARYKNRCKGISNITYYNSIKEVCLNSDIVLISLPLTKETNNIITKEILNEMKDKYIINVGRAEVINEKDLFVALKQKILKGAALDVWYRYPKKGDELTPISNEPFHELDNVLMSPHCSAHTLESREKAMLDTYNNVVHYLEHNEFINVVKNGY